MFDATAYRILIATISPSEKIAWQRALKNIRVLPETLLCPEAEHV